MRILLLGKSGQVGWELQRSLAPLGCVIALDRNSTTYCGNLNDPAGITETILAVRPQVIVNAAAYTAVDKAESEAETARLLNATSVESIARAAAKINAWVVHYSTDYVFSGVGEKAWLETDIADPINTYGRSKLDGELAIQQYCANHLIFRTSWVYASKGKNFAKTMLALAKDRSELSVINDQFGAPTGAELLADCTAHAIVQAMNKPELAGIYHLVASGCTNWHDYAALIFNEARSLGTMLKIEKLNSIPTSSFPTAAKRPNNSRLNNLKFQNNFSLFLPEWDVGIKRMLAELLTDTQF